MTAVAPRAGRSAGLSAERRFYLFMAVAILAAVLLGFSRSFFLRPLFPDREVPKEAFFTIHGIIFTTWFVVLVVQASLVSTRRVGTHRKFGVFGFAVALAMLVMGTYGVLVAAGRPTGFIGVPGSSLKFMAIPFFDMVNFALLTGFAVAMRTDPQSHKRFILLASISLITAAIGRWPGMESGGQIVYYAVTDLFLIPLALWDLRSRGRLHPVTLWAGLWMVASQPARMLFAKTALWMAFAKWSVTLVQ